MILIMSWHSLFDGAPTRRLALGAALFRRDDLVERVYVVNDGRVELERSLPNGEGLVLARAEAGTMLAEASLFAERYHCDAVARRSSVVASLDRAKFLEQLRRHPELALGLLADASGEVQRQRARIEILRLKRVTDRLDAWLTLYDPPGPGGWIDVAEAIGITPPALYRELAKRRRR